MKREELVRAAKEMNKVMGLKPPIDIKLPDSKLQAAIIANAVDVSPEDEFSEETTEVLSILCPPADEPEAPAEEAAEAEAPAAPAPAAPAAPAGRGTRTTKPAAAAAAPAKPKTLPEIVASTSKLSELKALVGEKDEFKGIRKTLDGYTGLSGPKDLKAAMYKALGVEAPVTAKADDTRKITVVSKENPKKSGTKAAERFALYKNGMTVAEFVKAGGTTGDVDWDSKKGFITLSK